MNRPFPMEIPQIGVSAANGDQNPTMMSNPMMRGRYDDDWKVAMSRKYKKKYFYNTRTGAKSWRVPKDMDPVKAKATPPAKTLKRKVKRKKKNC